MKQIQLFLIPQPGSKPEFLATLEPVDPSPVVLRLWNSSDLLPSQVILEGYTKEGWAWKPNTTANNAAAANLQNFTVTSVDGRNKLPGFLNYLKQRQKSAYGRIPASKGCFVVPFVQTSNSISNSNKNTSTRMECRFSMDLTQIPNCSLKPSSSSSTHTAATGHRGPSTSTAAASISKKSSSSSSSKKLSGGGGLLGKLVGAQKRTNQHMVEALAAGAAAAGAAPNANGAMPAAATEMTDAAAASTTIKSAQRVLADFRQAMLDKMMNFDLAGTNEQVLKFSVSLAEQTAGLEASDKEKVTMQLLKYMVYEAAEETHDEWIAYREPSEFVDEAHFAIYKSADVAPPEVLEELNKGDLPDEVRGQQKALQEERQRQVQQMERKQQQQVVYYDDDEDLEVLNQQKRDRRTIEDYEREKREQQPQKRRR